MKDYGYTVANSTASDILFNKSTGWGFDHIERIDEMEIFDGDFSATLQAEKDGYNIVWYNGIGYIRTLEVVEAILNQTRKDSMKK